MVSYGSYNNFDSDNFIYDLLHMPWSDIKKCTVVDVALDTWMTLFVGVCDKHASVKRRKVKRKKQLDYLTGDTVAAMRITDEHKSYGM